MENCQKGTQHSYTFVSSVLILKYVQAILIIDKFLTGDIVQVSSRSESQQQAAPALTFCMKNDFKNLSILGLKDKFTDICNSSSMEELEQCYARYTYNHTEIIDNISIGNEETESYMAPQYWTSYFQTVLLGRLDLSRFLKFLWRRIKIYPKNNESDMY